MPTPQDMPFTLDQILHMAELFSIAAGAVTVAFKIGAFTQAIEQTNKNFVKEMEESKQDRRAIHDEIKVLAEVTSKEISDLTVAMQKDNVFSMQIANVEKGLNELREWYDQIRRGDGFIRKQDH